jgi:hypothetical protein
MSAYPMPEIREPEPVGSDVAILVSSGDSRMAANREGWPAQEKMEGSLTEAFAAEGITVKRGHAYDPKLEHGFIWSQAMGMEVFQRIHPRARLIVAEAVWQYSHHVLAGLRDHRGPILTVGNWSGQRPGLVGLLNLNACLTKIGVPYSSIWSESFDDEFFFKSIRQWIKEDQITHDCSHVRNLEAVRLPEPEAALGRALACELKHKKAILGVFDEGCMGMSNAIIEDDLLNACGIYKERLSQSALVAAMRRVTGTEAQAARRWLDEQGMRFSTGTDEASELTDAQILEQLKLYIAAMRIAHEFGCDAIGIQYQQGLKDMTPASDLAEGLFNNVERPPVYHATTGAELYPGQALPHFNEVDEGAAVDALVTNRAWTAIGLDPSTTLHDIRWGRHYHGSGIDDFVWVFEISGGAPASHFVDGYAGAVSERQPPMYFPLGGGTLKGVSKPGEIVWSRVFIMDGCLHADLGRGTVVALPEAETRERWEATTEQWPMMSAVLHGVTRDQMMARHKANHIQVVYAPDAITADRALAVKAAMFAELGLRVHLCGKVNLP